MCAEADNYAPTSLKAPVITPTLVEALFEAKEQVRRSIYRKIADFKVTAWRTPEPTAFASRMTGEPGALAVGDKWGRQLFDCAWFCFTAEVGAIEGLLVARIDVNGELALVDGQGQPVRGLTCVDSVFDRRLGTPGKTVYQLPASALGTGRIELWGDAGFNCLFGSVPGDGKLAMAEVCVCRNDLRALFYDLEVLHDLVAEMPELPPTFAGLAEMVSASLPSGATLTPEEVAAFRARLAPLFGRSGAHSSLEVSAIGHAHLDLAWLWPLREGVRKAARTFSTALYNLERYPDYIFGASQPQQYAWMKESYPPLYERIKGAVRAGRIEPLGSMWVEPDCNIPNGESLVRQIMLGAAFFREEFGSSGTCCWQPDAFGYNGQLPQIMKRAGMDWFVTQKISWNLVNRFPHHSFTWTGIDGTSVLAHMLPEETYNGPAAPHSLRKIANEYAQREVSSHALMVFGIGDGGGGPDGEHLERLAREGHLADLPSVRIRPTRDFFERWNLDEPKFPRWTGELYLERHQGTFTTQAKTKRNNRLCEVALFELECVASLASTLAAIPYPSAELDILWKEVLLYQFHDILPGSSIKRVYDECTPRYAAILEEIGQLTAARCAALAGRIATKGQPVVFNPLAWPRAEWLQVGSAWRWMEVPAMGYAVSSQLQPGPASSLAARPDCLENEHLCICFAEDGSITSIFDKDARREVIAPGEFANRFVVYADKGDAWDFPADYADAPPRVPALQRSSTRIDGPCACLHQSYTLAASRLDLQITLKSRSRLIEFSAKAEWGERDAMLRVQFPVQVEAPQARFEIQYGSIVRSTRLETSHEKAQSEVPAQQWVDLADEEYGVALVNDCKYGFRVKGRTIDMNLIRSVPHPNRARIAQDDESGPADDSLHTDLGVHHFRYALAPHRGATDEAELTRIARCFNVPLRVVPVELNAAEAVLPATFSLFGTDDGGTEITAVKRAQDGRGWIVRLNRVKGTGAVVQLRTMVPFQRAWETSLVEQDLLEITPASSRPGPLMLKLGAYEIKTLRLI